MPKISTTVITLNEEENIARCIKSVQDFSDEIIVVDSGSTDSTSEIARKLGAKVFTRKFDNYANQKNYAAQKAIGDWIFSIDADEVVSQKLSKEIKDVVQSPSFDGYTIPRQNIILGKFIRFSRWQPELDRHIWLWKKGKANWVGDIHEEVVVKGSVGRIKSAKIHYQDKTVKEFLEMMNRYSNFDAKYRIKNGTRFSIIKLFLDPAYNFLIRYFYRLGILDGWRGFVLSYLMAVYHFELWIKIWQFQKNKN